MADDTTSTTVKGHPEIHKTWVPGATEEYVAQCAICKNKKSPPPAPAFSPAPAIQPPARKKAPDVQNAPQPIGNGVYNLITPYPQQSGGTAPVFLAQQQAQAGYFNQLLAYGSPSSLWDLRKTRDSAVDRYIRKRRPAK